MSLLSLFTAIDSSSFSDAIRSSAYLYPTIEAFHLIGLSIVGGAVLLIDLRLLGYGLKDRPVPEIAKTAQPFLVGSVILMLVSGVLLFVSEAVKCYYHGAFWFKMIALALAILFTFTVQRKIMEKNQEAKLVAIVSLALWSCVGIGGRWIGFS